MTTPSFSELKLNDWLIRRCATIGVKHPTPIQASCIPEIMQGKDCIGAAKTGSGKTLAFTLPILHEWLKDRYGIYALILTPQRELAHQIGGLIKALGKPLNLRCSVIVGGMDMVTQGLELARPPHFVVATPGRLADHIQGCNTFTLSRIKYLVLDEADRLLGGDFNEQIQTIFATLPKKRQNLLFSATITDKLEIVKRATKNEVFMYEAPAETATVVELEQRYVMCPQDIRDVYFVETLRTYRAKDTDGGIIIFTDSCPKCEAMSIMLNEVGFENVAMHSMMKQKDRLASLTKFKSHVVKILVATDVASRGLDIPKVQLVLNHFLPQSPTDYIHRVGRTARAGRRGQAISLVSPDDIPNLKEIEKRINVTMTEYKVNDKEIEKIFLEVFTTRSEAYCKMEEQNFYEKKMVNKRKRWILEGLDPDEEEKKMRRKNKKYKKNKKEKRLGDGVPSSSE